MTRTKQPFIQAILRLNRYLSRYELILLLLCLTVFLRLPSLFEPAWYGDENIYLSIGQSVASGARLYQDITDYPNKPPMIYLLAAVTGSVPAFRFILLVWQIFGTLAFFLLISRLIESKTARVLATLAYIFLTSTPVLEGNVANAEIFFIVPVMFAAWLIFTHATRPRTRKTLLLVTGLAMGFAFLFKIHVLLDIFAFSLYLVFDRFIFHRRILKLLKRNFHLLLYLAGLAVPILVTLLLLKLGGVSPLYLLTTALGSGKYISSWGTQDILLQTIGMGSLVSRGVLFAVIVMLLIIFRRQLTRPVFFASLWFISDLFAVLLSGRPYPHYLIQLIPSFLLLFSLGLTQSKRSFVPFVTAFVLILLAWWRFQFGTYPVIPYYQNALKYVTKQQTKMQFYANFDQRVPRNYVTAQVIAESTMPQDRIFVWGNESDLYFLSRRLPVERLVTAFHVADLNYYQTIMTALKQSPPPIIVVIESDYRSFPQLFDFLNEYYLVGERIGSPLNNSLPQAIIYRLSSNFVR